MVPVCVPVEVPARYAMVAAQNAWKVNRKNEPVGVEPQRIAIETTKYWGPDQRTLSTSFMESTSRALRNKILDYLNIVQLGVTFAYTEGRGTIRISRGPGGYYSYLGTDNLSIPANRQTMNLDGFTLNTRESEYKRVVTHEGWHALGCPHEHQRKAVIDRIDRNKAYAYFKRTSGWNRSTVDSQVLTPLNERSLMSTPVDVQSIMAYSLPAQVMKDGIAVPGGSEVTPTDKAFMQKHYPPAGPVEPEPDPEPTDPIEPLPDGPEWSRPFEDIDWT